MLWVYCDSSVLLSILLKESRTVLASSWWEENVNRVSSVLLEAESLINVRRHAARHIRDPLESWLQERTGFLTRHLSDITLKPVDESVLRILHREKTLADCRTLDAVHLATALYFREKSGEEIAFATFDARLRETASRLGFPALPAA